MHFCSTTLSFGSVCALRIRLAANGSKPFGIRKLNAKTHSIFESTPAVAIDLDHVECFLIRTSYNLELFRMPRIIHT